MMVAYNRSIADETRKRLPKQEFSFSANASDVTIISAETVHSAGKKMLESNFGTIKIDGLKFYKIVRSFVETELRLWGQEGQDVQSALREMISLFRLKLINPENKEGMLEMVRHHGIGFPGLVDFVPEVYHRGLMQFEKDRSIDFDDMIFLPIFLPSWSDTYKGLHYDQHKLVLVDECQDLNRLQFKTALELVKDDGKLVFVGDRKQAIYGFIGADEHSFDHIISRTNAKEMPLSVCFRCPETHLDLIRKYVPQIQGKPNNPDGSVHHLDYDHFIRNAGRYLKPDDLIVCRTNAPLVGTCARLINQGIKARIRGRDLGGMLKKIIKKTAKLPGFDFKKFSSFIWKWAGMEMARLRKAGASKTRIESVSDYALAIISVQQQLSYVHSVSALMDSIDGFFRDDKDAIWLSSVHKAKGLEAENVYVLGPEKMPLLFEDSQEWEFEQEKNIIMISLSRAKNRLVFIKMPEKAKDDI